MSFIDDSYAWILVVHIVAFTAWMAGLWYLPRLFVYHVGAKKGSELSKTFKVMERKLLRIIMNPAMVLTLITGFMLSVQEGTWQQGWFHSKLLLVVAMLGYHGFLAQTRRYFADDQNRRSVKFFRIINEIPTALFILIVILIITKPF